MKMGYTDTNGHRVTTAPRLPGFQSLCLFTAAWAAAAAGARLSRPPALGEAPAGYPGGDHPNIANVAYNVLTYIPEQTALVIAAALIGWAIAAGIDDCYTLGARRHRRVMMSVALATPLAWPLGIGPALAGLAIATFILWPTSLHPERATPQLALLCAAAAVAGPLFNLFEHYGTLLEQGRQFGDDAGDLTGWASNTWQTSQPWAAEAQRAQSTGSWAGWWNLQTTLGFTKETSYRVYTATMLACTGLLLGLRIGSEKRPMTYARAIRAVHRQYLILLGTIGAGTAATMLSILNDWEGLGPRLAAAVSVVTALLAGRLILETPRVDETNRLVAASRATAAEAGNDGRTKPRNGDRDGHRPETPAPPRGRPDCVRRRSRRNPPGPMDQPHPHRGGVLRQPRWHRDPRGNRGGGHRDYRGILRGSEDAPARAEQPRAEPRQHRHRNPVRDRSPGETFPACPVRVPSTRQVPQRSPLRYPGGKSRLIPHVRLWLSSLRRTAGKCQRSRESDKFSTLVGALGSGTGLLVWILR